MSLNGLDDAKVVEAYQGALAEGGGWFLLKYVSRDAVEVLARGTGGTAEARGALAQYEEKSPLFGFLLYRRRKVLIRYTPEGTSRLLQARVAVHFIAVTEKFTPHDTTISMTSPDELSDTALASACSLHTAAPSSCSSSASSRRNRLDEITEDAEEAQGTGEDATSAARPATAASTNTTITGLVASRPNKSEQLRGQAPVLEPPLAAAAFERPKSIEKPKTASSSVVVGTIPENLESGSRTSHYRDSLKDFDALFENGPDPRMSSQTARPALSDLYADIYAQYKPKVKLGPRPTTRPSFDSGRPHTSNDVAQHTARPISSLPPGMRIATRKSAKEPRRPKSRDSSVVPSIAFPPAPPVPNMPEIPPPSPTIPPKSPASVRSMPVSYKLHSHRSHGMTQEKQRLMKAVELRKKQMKAKLELEESKKKKPDDNLKDMPTDMPDKTLNGEAPPFEGSSGTNEETHVDAALKPEQPAPEAEQEQQNLSPPIDGAVSNQVKSPIQRVQPGSAVPRGQTEIDDLHSAASASSPTSAETQGSSRAASTRPSSISEEDHAITERGRKHETLKEAPTESSAESSDQANEKLVEPVQTEDEEASVESTPTVVPENLTPAPSAEVSVQEPTQPTSEPQEVSDNMFNQKFKRESMILMPPGGHSDTIAKRRSKRESMIFLPSVESTKRQSYVEGKEKRRTMTDPLLISAENSEAEYLSDDSFMEELKSAKVEEAKPVNVSKSPLAPFFPRKSSGAKNSTSERSFSQPHKPGRLSPSQLKPRSSSGPWLPHSSSDAVVTAKKINVSSGISQRIKALAEKSNRDSTIQLSALATPDASASTVAQRKTSFFSTPPTAASSGGQSIRRLSHASFANLSPSPALDKRSVLHTPPSRESSREGPAVYNVQHAFQKPESVQVTARIVRDNRLQSPTLAMPTETTPLELHQSQITIDHQKSLEPVPKSPAKSSISNMEPKSPSHSREPSGTTIPRSSTESTWKAFGRRFSESKSNIQSPVFQRPQSPEAYEERREEKKEKKDSRTSKLFKRMSAISPIKRKSHAEEAPSNSLPSLREPPPAVQIGDLNVQFPDTLLWKRRWVEIDGMGYLVLSFSKSNEQSKGITKRFHMSEFRTPYSPDQDRQELPNSVMLDFRDGRTLQCACETYMAQVQILQILREAHDAWIAYNLEA